MSRCRLQITADGIYLDSFLLFVIKTVDLNLVNTIIHTKDKAIVWHSSGAGHMWAEVSLCHTAVASVKYAIYDLSYRTVWI